MNDEPVKRHRHIGLGDQATFCWEKHGKVFAVWDDVGSACAVRDDLDNVIAHLCERGALNEYPDHRVIYRDGETWAEIRPVLTLVPIIAADTAEAAIAAVTARG